MRFIRRKKQDEQPQLCCPLCRELVPEDASVCHMCGERLDPYLAKVAESGGPVKVVEEGEA